MKAFSPLDLSSSGMALSYRDETAKFLSPLDPAQQVLYKVMETVRQSNACRATEMMKSSIPDKKRQAFNGMLTRKVIEKEKLVHIGFNGWIRDPNAEDFPPWSRNAYRLMRKGVKRELGLFLEVQVGRLTDAAREMNETGLWAFVGKLADSGHMLTDVNWARPWKTPTKNGSQQS